MDESKQLRGSRKEQAQIDALGTLLKGRASDWFADEVESIDRTKWDWTFEEVVCALHKELFLV